MRLLIPVIMIALTVASTARPAQAKPGRSFNAFYQANKNRRTQAGTLEEIYKRTFKANTVGRWMGEGKGALGKAAYAAASVVPYFRRLRRIKRAARTFKMGKLAYGLTGKGEGLKRTEESKAMDAFYLTCMAAPPLAKVGLGVFAANLSVSATRAARDVKEAFCISRASVLSAARQAGFEGADRPLLEAHRAELGRMLVQHTATRRRSSATIRDHRRREMRAEAELGARDSFWSKAQPLAKKILHDEVITSNIATLKREHKAIRSIQQVIDGMNQQR